MNFKIMTSWPDDVQFIPCSIPHESLSPTDRDELETCLVGCQCRPCSSNCSDPQESCNESSCQCLSRSAPYDTSGLLEPEYRTGNGPPIIECGQLCGCAMNISPLTFNSTSSSKPECWSYSVPCRNRTVGYSAELYRLQSEKAAGNYSSARAAGNYPSVKSAGNCQTWKFLHVFPTADKGFGLRCSVDLPAGAFVCEYAGELVSVEEAQKRTKEHSDTYLFAIRESSDASVTTTCIDARVLGNWGRMINHACDPNLIMLPVRIDTIIPRLCFFAKKDVKAGDELMVDYDQGNEFTEDLPVDVSAAKRSGTDFSRKKCVCGSGCCRGFLPFNRQLFDAVS